MGLRAAAWGVRGNSLRLKADDACAVVDISAGTASLHEARLQYFLYVFLAAQG